MTIEKTLPTTFLSSLYIIEITLVVLAGKGGVLKAFLYKADKYSQTANRNQGFRILDIHHRIGKNPISGSDEKNLKKTLC